MKRILVLLVILNVLLLLLGSGEARAAKMKFCRTRILGKCIDWREHLIPASSSFRRLSHYTASVEHERTCLCEESYDELLDLRYGGGAQTSEDSCDPQELKVCVDGTPRTPVGLPRTREELDKHCL
ncbi:hypothetical protein KGM_214529 [Danaus plexippus plexippus]|uniref:Uncharacterized protein n=1 Tax=Danaus plexippus plexippus TaxID=278856 RepID=A0A212EU45_DANPL|nr:hypothetical protein KGM_214529 [Danaus plexippus plexippus]